MEPPHDVGLDKVAPAPLMTNDFTLAEGEIVNKYGGVKAVPLPAVFPDVETNVLFLDVTAVKLF